MSLILVVDDDKSVRESIKMILEYEKYSIEFAENGQTALNKLSNLEIDLVLLDVKMAGMTGIEVLTIIQQTNKNIPVIMISGHGTIETAVEATKIGAFDFLPKPLDRDKLIITVRNALKHYQLKNEFIKLKQTIDDKRKILGESKKIKEVLSLIDKVAPSDARVLITGENGTGKELIARYLHQKSKRAENLFVEVNCAAIPSELIESELFGHEKGSFTGATNLRIGKFEQANTGTLFLDEIGDMSMQAQAKVLRVLEEGTFERVGGDKLIKVDVRVIAATNKNLLQQIENGNFRKDLYHRLNVIEIQSPPLRERKEDIPILVNAFIKDFCNKNGIAEKQISDEAIEILKQNEWHGNIRELRNTVERLVILSTQNFIDSSLLKSPYKSSSNDYGNMFDLTSNFQEFKDNAEKIFIQKQLEANNYNITKTAEVLQIQRSHLYTKMKKYGLMKSDMQEEE